MYLFPTYHDVPLKAHDSQPLLGHCRCFQLLQEKLTNYDLLRATTAPTCLLSFIYSLNPHGEGGGFGRLFLGITIGSHLMTGLGSKLGTLFDLGACLGLSLAISLVIGTATLTMALLVASCSGLFSV